MSISVNRVRPSHCCGGTIPPWAATASPPPPKPIRVIASARLPWTSSSFPPPASGIESSFVGGVVRASSACRRSPAATRTVEPEAFTQSGSSTPCSWTLVGDSAGASSRPETGCGACGAEPPPPSPAPELSSTGSGRGGGDTGLSGVSRMIRVPLRWA